MWLNIVKQIQTYINVKKIKNIPEQSKEYRAITNGVKQLTIEKRRNFKVI